jgi:DNA-binding GntR family transcriptional regulator
MRELLDQKVQAKSLVDVVAERIEAAIISGVLEPGSRLSEQGLAASLGVSKLLERTPNIGVRVAALSLKDLNEILQIREALEGLACALAAVNMTEAEIAGLKKLLDEHERQKSVQDGKGYYQESKDFDFHFRIVTGSRNERLAQMLLGDLYYLLRIYRYKSSTKPGRAVKALQEHREVVAAIEARDPGLAEQKMRDHLRNARLYVEEQLAVQADAAPEPAVTRKGERVGVLKPTAVARRR